MTPPLRARPVDKVYGGIADSEPMKHMETRLRRTSLFALYQMSIVLGIALLPVALLARRVGVELPFGAFVDRLGAAYETATEE